jgi:hypothetical protein
LNGVPGKAIHCKCGVRQGDPLYPLLFVLAADLLQSIVNEAFHQNLIQLPIDNSFGQAFPIVQYADDTLIIMQANARQLFFLKCLLHSFGESTGLKVNFNNSFIVPINVGEEQVSILAGTLGCLVETMPFTYLGLPLGTTKPSVQDFLPVFSRIEKRIMRIASFISYSGQLMLVTLVLSALPTYYMCILEPPMEIINHINKYRRLCFWRDNDLNNKGNCLAAWSKVQKPKSQGGLGVIDSTVQNRDLLFKHLHKFFNKHDIPWVDFTWKAYYTTSMAPQERNPRGSFWWRALCRLFDHFRGMSKSVVSRGDTTMFWRDVWNFGSLKDLYPHLFSFVREPKCSVSRFLSFLLDYDRIFQLPLSMPVSHQLVELMDSLAEWHREPNENDQWVYIWGSGIFTSKQAYENMKGNQQVSPPF